MKSIEASRLWVILLPVLFLSGCQAVTYQDYFTESYMFSRWLPLVEDNTTTREQIIERLGPPSRSFENGRLATYRIMINEWHNGLSDKAFRRYCTNKYAGNGPFENRDELLKILADRRVEDIDRNGSLLVLTEENRNKYEKEILAGIAEFHLVLVFDDTSVLKRHALIRIQP